MNNLGRPAQKILLSQVEQAQFTASLTARDKLSANFSHFLSNIRIERPEYNLALPAAGAEIAVRFLEKLSEEMFFALKHRENNGTSEALLNREHPEAIMEELPVLSEDAKMAIKQLYSLQDAIEKMTALAVPPQDAQQFVQAKARRMIREHLKPAFAPQQIALSTQIGDELSRLAQGYQAFSQKYGSDLGEFDKEVISDIAALLKMQADSVRAAVEPLQKNAATGWVRA